MKTTTLLQLTLTMLVLSLAGHAQAESGHSKAEQITTQSREFQFDKPLTAESQASQKTKSDKREKLATLTSKSRESTQSLNETEFWIYDSWVSVANDYDYDGYYTTLTVEFDADTVFASVPVYAVIYLGRNDVYDSIHVTSTFSIYGEASDDAFIVESDLLSGFPPREYDILIELYDAHSDVLLAASDGYWDADLAYVSLESENYDVVEETVVVVEEHGGALFIPALLALFGVAVYRRRN